MSGPNKSVELQFQVRHQAEELRDFMRELDGWEKDIKKKDEDLRRQSGVSLPPIRNRDFKKKTNKKPVSQNNRKNGEKKATRIKSYDYKSWEKFDVDKVLEEMDKTDSTPEPDTEEEVDAEKALAEKEKGNNFFKEGKYDEAMECYTRAMTMDPYNPVFPTNRAATFLKMKKYAVAESDCNLAIALDKAFFKAYLRRGSARFKLNNLQGAKEDFEMVLSLDAGNFEATNELRKVNEALDPTKSIKDQNWSNNEKLNAGEEKRVTEAQAKQQAIFEKDLGNDYFKQGKYLEAIECYTKGMTADGTNVLLPANRAMAFLKLEKKGSGLDKAVADWQRFAEAEADCSQAISLDNTYSKAFARRGTARLCLGKLKEAKEDFEMVLRLEPGNKQALTELGKINKELALQGDTLTKSLGEKDDGPRLVKAIDKPPHLRSTKPLIRIAIEEVGDKPSNINEIPAAVSSSDLPSNQTTALLSPEAPNAKILKVEECGGSPLISSRSGYSGVPDKGEAVAIANSTKVKKPESSLPHHNVPIPLAPANAFQLEADLRKLKNYPEMVHKYLKQIEPSFYPQLFQKSLEPDILNHILRILHDLYIRFEEPSLIFDVLKNLSNVKRFDMAVMFMSDPERKVVKELFDHLRKSGIEEPLLIALKSRYSV
ncbi:RNA polymerase II-associated protein 3 isoform X2 [Hypanus sabinus]|uniref:RNA polymerase II-associated protein 3 isoform X2 n=1 Tax=Hypanus sabinus TaxID=79690 RepID=UPI0028C3BAEA|nr:RNA polymerase II-associated protein 3 isoform X2 [Hypanus sabinus]